MRDTGACANQTGTMNRPMHAIETYYQNGLKLHGAGRLPEAEQAYRQVLAAQPGHADAMHMLGVLASQCGQPQAALACLDQAIALKPSAVLFHVNRAGALLALRQLDAAEAACREALRLKRNCAEAWQVLGHVLADANRSEDAVAAYRGALRLKSDLPEIHSHLGLALRLSGRLDDAAVALRQEVRRAPRDALAHGNLASIMKELGRLDEAEAEYRTALRLRPDDAVAHLNLGVVLLLAGRLPEGWPEYAWRFRAGAVRIPACERPRWGGEPLDGRTLLVRAEQGLGDTIQFCRYVRGAIARGPVVFEVQPGLRRLMSHVIEPERIVQVGEALPAFDVWCPLLDLPLLLGTGALQPPYLVPEPDRVAMWRQRIGPQGRRVGIAWQGNPAAAAERGRSVPLTEFLPLSRIPGVRLIGLQKHHGMDQLAALPEGMVVETLGEDFDAGPDAFADTAAAMQSLDLVISSDTAIPHLAGALGRPVWVALQHVPDWRFQIAGETSGWYPSMRLFRQAKRGDWAGVFTRIARTLETTL
jgi:tetratricopeptide (TPR) repeat protein